MRVQITGLVVLALIGCGELPDVPLSTHNNDTEVDYPNLVNLRTLELTAAEDEAEALETEQATAARVANLRARAAELKRFELD